MVSVAHARTLALVTTFSELVDPEQLAALRAAIGDAELDADHPAEEGLETKRGVRRIRTPEGEKLYGKPIGSIITRDDIERHGEEPRRRGAQPPARGTPNTPGGTSAEARARATAAARERARPGTPQPGRPSEKAKAQPEGERPPAKTPEGVSEEAMAALAEIVMHGRPFPPAKGTKDDPVDVGGDLDAAVRHLANGRHVRLNQPDEVATLMDKLNAAVKKARDAGENPPNINLCQVSAPGTNLFCAESKGIPRVKMPQLSGTPDAGSPAAALMKPGDKEANITAQFRQALEAMGVAITPKNVSASHLRASQDELDGPKVAGMSRAMKEGKVPDAPIFVTRDGYIIDGHHRWASKVAIDSEDGSLGDVRMPVDVVDMDIGAALDFANEFALSMGIRPKGLGAAAEGVPEKKADCGCHETKDVHTASVPGHTTRGFGGTTAMKKCSHEGCDAEATIEIDGKGYCAEHAGERKAEAGGGMEHKNDPSTLVVEADDETGVVTSIVSVTGIPDRVDDVIEPGAYKDTLAQREPIGVWSHDDKIWVARAEEVKELLPGDPFFSTQEFVEARKGKPWPKEAGALLVKARFNLETPHGAAAYSDVKFFKGHTSWSIGYRTKNARRDMRTGKRHIKGLDLYEFSPVMVGAAPDSMTLSVKSLAGAHAVDPDVVPELVGQTEVKSLLTERDELEAYLETKAALAEVGELLAARDELAAALETKAQRRVRTPEGAGHFGQPIGSVIKPDALPPKAKTQALPSKPGVWRDNFGTRIAVHSNGAVTMNEPGENNPTLLAPGSSMANDLIALVNDPQNGYEQTPEDPGPGALHDYNPATGATSDPLPPKPKRRGTKADDTPLEVKEMLAARDAVAAILDEQLEEKRLRRVRTPEGARQYGQPVGSVIKPDAPGEMLASDYPSGPPKAGQGPGSTKPGNVQAKNPPTAVRARREAEQRRKQAESAENEEERTILRMEADVLERFAANVDTEDAAAYDEPGADPAEFHGGRPRGLKRLLGSSLPKHLKHAEKEAVVAIMAVEAVTLLSYAMHYDKPTKMGLAIGAHLLVGAGAAVRNARKESGEVKALPPEDLGRIVLDLVREEFDALDGELDDEAYNALINRVVKKGVAECREAAMDTESKALDEAEAEELYAEVKAATAFLAALETKDDPVVAALDSHLAPAEPQVEEPAGLFDAQTDEDDEELPPEGMLASPATVAEIVNLEIELAELGIVEAEVEIKGELDRSPRKNWVENSGGLPRYIEKIAKSLHKKRGMTISRAIATAIATVKRWAAGGDDVKADTRAKAAKALAEWEALRAKNKARQAAKDAGIDLTWFDQADEMELKLYGDDHEFVVVDSLYKLDWLNDQLEAKGLRRVRTPEGARLYGQPIGSVIKPDVSRDLGEMYPGEGEDFRSLRPDTGRGEPDPPPPPSASYTGKKKPGDLYPGESLDWEAMRTGPNASLPQQRASALARLGHRMTGGLRKQQKAEEEARRDLEHRARVAYYKRMREEDRIPSGRLTGEDLQREIDRLGTGSSSENVIPPGMRSVYDDPVIDDERLERLIAQAKSDEERTAYEQARKIAPNKRMAQLRRTVLHLKDAVLELETKADTEPPPLTVEELQALDDLRSALK